MGEVATHDDFPASNLKTQRMFNLQDSPYASLDTLYYFETSVSLDQDSNADLELYYLVDEGVLASANAENDWYWQNAEFGLYVASGAGVNALSSAIIKNHNTQSWKHLHVSGLGRIVEGIGLCIDLTAQLMSGSGGMREVSHVQVIDDSSNIKGAGDILEHLGVALYFYPVGAEVVEVFNTKVYALTRKEG